MGVWGGDLIPVAAQDQTLYKELLEKVRLGQAGALPKARLSDEVAKIKAAQLLSKTDEYF